MSKSYYAVTSALKESLKSKYKYQLGAVITKHGKIISKGHNQVKRGFSVNYGHWEGSLHAELAAILNARTSLKGTSLFVARSTGGLARPCKHCMAAIKASGIKWIHYTTGVGVDKERVM